MKNIVVNLKDESDLYGKYNNDVSKDLIKYLIEEAVLIGEDANIIINTKLKIDNIDEIIKKGLIKEYNESKKIDRIHNNKQIVFFLIGTIFLILSTFINYSVIKEIIIISGWVAIWEVVDISLNLDSKSKISRKIIKKLINSKIEINSR